MTSREAPVTPSRERPRRVADTIGALVGTIRGRIVIAFLVMSAITGVLGLSAASSIRRADELVSQTFDRSLMSINYARAAATDFAGMRSVEARRWVITDPVARAALDERLVSLQRLLAEDLEIAVARAQSDRATGAARAAEQAVSAWTGARAKLSERDRGQAAYAELDRHAAAAEENFDLFINYTAGDGFIYRQQARAIVARETRINLFGTLIAVLLSGTVAFYLSRRIMGPLADASQAASRIAAGDLSGTMPAGGADEVGTLLAAMGVMRDNIRQAMEREVAQRISAEDRLADALETSREGIVVVDETGRITLTNRQADDYLGFAAGTLPPGSAIADLAPRDGTARQPGPGPPQCRRRAQRVAPRGRPLAADQPKRNAQRRLHRGLQRHHPAQGAGSHPAIDQPAPRHRPRQHVQGLCLFDAAGRLTVVNRRYCEIFDLTPEDLPPGPVLSGGHGPGFWRKGRPAPPTPSPWRSPRRRPGAHRTPISSTSATAALWRSRTRPCAAAASWRPSRT